ncbi:flagellar hook-length control protein FliK [Jiella pelagia]|uniref:Flagellar hook-length control protein FliK n=1 Tax=Jiella pelagia TaxID=2986949 RepID=A0ABY7BYB2_9HYPH|nr:flagellar hook-length control protein FliK [Jiella pelagia]WAP67513.1 flagellar hook-length control protein FliK [Jiella pelagia]
MLAASRQGMLTSSTAQVADALATALGQMKQDANAPVGSDRTRLRAGGAALKTIQIQLAPENLGKVNVTLKLIGDNLTVHIEATEPETAHRLKDDGEGLKSLLKSAGFDVDEAVITLGSRDAAGARAPHQSGAQSDTSASGQSRDGSANGQLASDGQNGQGGRRDDGRSRQPQAAPGARSLEGTPEAGGRNMALDPSVYL